MPFFTCYTVKYTFRLFTLTGHFAFEIIWVFQQKTQFASLLLHEL